jgi:hypothetical protein
LGELNLALPTSTKETQLSQHQLCSHLKGGIFVARHVALVRVTHPILTTSFTNLEQVLKRAHSNLGSY